MISIETFAVNIQKYRLKAGISQSELARKLYVTPQTISKWESGLAVPDLNNLCGIANALAVSADLLLSDKPDVQKRMIAIDGGGTKTDFVLFCEDGRILKHISLGGSNPNVTGMDNACGILRQGIDMLLTADKSIVGIFAGIAGSMTGRNSEKLTAFLEKQYRNINITVSSDIQNVINCRRSTDRCIAVICGTGSVIYANDGAQLHRIGGWGYMFDGAGSGFDIGRDVISACLAYDDKLQSESLTVQLAEKKLGGSASGKLDLLYAKGNDYIASFAPIAFEACRMAINPLRR